MLTTGAHGQPGAIIAGKYRLLENIGHGGMGSVWRAEHVTLGAPVALKLVNPALLRLGEEDRGRVLKRFLREARAAAAIRSPHVVQILDHGLDDDVPFMVLELLEGETLEARLERARALSFAETARIVTHIGRALTRAHEAGLVHRDLKPSNVFLVRNDDEELAKILDFGLVKVSTPWRDREATSLTQRGQLIGTPYFMSPEQVQGRQVDYRADLWAVAVITFRCLCGRLPFDSAVASELVLQICSEPPPVPSRCARVPDGFDEWFARATHRDAKQRFPSAREMADALRALAPAADAAAPRAEAAGAGRATAPSLRETPAHGGRPRALIMAAGALSSLGLAAAAVLHLVQRGGEPGAAPQVEGARAAAEVDRSLLLPSAEAARFLPSPSAACPARMALIPGGSFVMGSQEPAFKLGQPAHRVMLDPFCLDVFEVTAADYKACSDMGECKRPQRVPEPPRPAGVPAREVQKRTAALAGLCTFGRADLARHPMNCISWHLADAYCRMQSKRLPTEAEWEYAARGAEGRRFPWGEEPAGALLLNACGAECSAWQAAHGVTLGPRTYDGHDGFAATSPVGAYPRGMTRSGVHDLLGNVAEWTADWFETYSAGDVVNPKGAKAGDRKAVRGGGFDGGFLRGVDTGFRDHPMVHESSPAIGFRCAQDL